jgi:hypothetical protein
LEEVDFYSLFPAQVAIGHPFDEELAFGGFFFVEEIGVAGGFTSESELD